MTFDYYSWLVQCMQEKLKQLSRLHGECEKAQDKGDKRRLKYQISEEVDKVREQFEQKIKEQTNFECAWPLSSGFIDCVTTWWFSDKLVLKERARADVYIPIVKKIQVPRPGLIENCLDFRPNFHKLLSRGWLGLEVEFELLTPWYSKDDRLFHVLDNPVRKDKVFGVPFMSAASWKGLLRWACRMQAGLREHLEKHNGRLENWRDPDWILYLFGNEKGEEENFQQGTLVFYSTWFGRINFEVINPHKRETRAGTQPIYYEVVPPEAPGTLYLLYAPWPGMQHAVEPQDVIPRLLEAIDDLLTNYGISAKRTVGWGTAKITMWHAFPKGVDPICASSRDELVERVMNVLQQRGVS